jgi:hypothetical protein
MKPKFNPDSHAYYSYMTNNVFLFLSMKPDIDLATFTDTIQSVIDAVDNDEDASYGQRRYAIEYLYFILETIPEKLNIQ